MPADVHVHNPRVAAVLVVHNGLGWLPSVLSTVAAQRGVRLDLLVVDNGSRDGSTELLARHVPPERLLCTGANLGFAAAVAQACTTDLVATADFVLLLHDDLLLAPDAVSRLVSTLLADPGLGVVGPKLRVWGADDRLSEIGWTIDRFGRAQSPLEPVELDQGQHDRPREVLYLSTAGMLVRRELFQRLGGLDVRFPAFRDDLDLCWRAWMAGARVRLEPAAVGYHVRAAARAPHARGRPGLPPARALIERHTLATVCKNAPARRLLLVLPVMVALSAAQVVGCLLTRRLHDAAAVVGAYAWNIANLGRTLALRRVVRRQHAVPDERVTTLFAPGLPRLHPWGEALRDWASGEGAPQPWLPEAAGTLAHGGPPAGPAVRLGARRLGVWAALALGVAYLVSLAPLLGSGPLVGGEIAPWPDSPQAFLQAYTGAWGSGPLAGPNSTSPFVALLGVLSAAAGGSSWLAQRMVVMGLIPLAWVLAVRAGRLLTARRLPRLVGASLYALSPAVLSTVSRGALGAAVTAALLPGLVLLAARAASRRTMTRRAWRASGLLALGLATAVTAAPRLWPVHAGVLVGAMAGCAGRGGLRRALRLTVPAAVLAGALAPWVVGLSVHGWPDAALPALPSSLAVVRAATGAAGLAVLDGPYGAAAAALLGLVVLCGIAAGSRREPGIVAALVAVTTVGGLGVATLARGGPSTVDASGPLLGVALALAALGTLVARFVVEGLRATVVGWRRMATIVTGALVTLAVCGGLALLASDPWTGLRRDQALVPAFVAADAAAVGPYRVLLLSADGARLRWDVTGPSGPTVLDTVAAPDMRLARLLGRRVAATAQGADPRAGVLLGMANVRYVVVRPGGTTARLQAGLQQQPALEPLPSGAGRVYRVRSWLPRAVLLPRADLAALTAGTIPTGFEDDPPRGLHRVRPGLYRGDVTAAPGADTLLLAEAAAPTWRAEADGRALAVRAQVGLTAFEVPAGARQVRVAAVGATDRRVQVALLVIALLSVASLIARPPGPARRGRRHGPAAATRASTSEADPVPASSGRAAR